MRKSVYSPHPDRKFERTDLEIAYSKLSPEERKSLNRQRGRLTGYKHHADSLGHNKNDRGIYFVGELGSLEILATLARFMDENEYCPVCKRAGGHAINCYMDEHAE